VNVNTSPATPNPAGEEVVPKETVSATAGIAVTRAPSARAAKVLRKCILFIVNANILRYCPKNVRSGKFVTPLQNNGNCRLSQPPSDELGTVRTLGRTPAFSRLKLLVRQPHNKRFRLRDVSRGAILLDWGSKSMIIGNILLVSVGRRVLTRWIE